MMEMVSVLVGVNVGGKGGWNYPPPRFTVVMDPENHWYGKGFTMVFI